MRVLVACEYSGKVREAFRKLGHDAWSCDLLPSDDNSSYHIQGDVLKWLDKHPRQFKHSVGSHSDDNRDSARVECHCLEGWNLMIAHPPCTYLTNAGVSWLYRKEGRWEDMREGAEFFKKLLDAPIPFIAVENPIMHKYAVEIIGRRQDQVIQPWMFGHMEQKATCLWLKGLPLLKPTNDVKEEMNKLPKEVRQRLHYLPPSKDRWKIRSETFQGIADAFAAQWGDASQYQGSKQG